MKILAIESSAKAASVAIVEDNKILGEVFLNCGLTHSVTIMPAVEWLLSVSGLFLSDIGKIAITKGPGSFTGLRIGMAVLKGMAWACNIPCCGVSTLEAIAAQGIALGGTICAVMDARANQVYNAIFKVENGSLVRMTEDRAITIPELFTELEIYNDVVFIGDGAELCFEKSGKKHRIAPEQLLLQRAASVAMLAKATPELSAHELLPEYIRLPQAERERLERLNNKK